MADKVMKVKYVYAMVPNRAGQGVKILGALKDTGVNMLAFSAFPSRGGKSQVDIVTENVGVVRRIAKKHGWRLSPPRKAFLIQGPDEVGAVHRHARKLAAANVNVTAADAVTAGSRRYGMILWVRNKDYTRAARALGAR